MRRHALPLIASQLLAATKLVLMATLAVVLLAALPMLSATEVQAAWLEKLVPAGETYTVTATDRDVAFLIDGYIYDARKFCYLNTGDRVVFFEGRHGIDYYATLYDLDARERCEVLLRGRYYGE